MAELSSVEKMKLEKFLEMGGGYILDFSNRTLQEFVYGSVGLDIYDDKYFYASGSKANRFRAFWNQEPHHIVCKLLTDLLEYWHAKKQIDNSEITSTEQILYDDCLRITSRLKQNDSNNKTAHRDDDIIQDAETQGKKADPEQFPTVITTQTFIETIR